MIEISLPVVLRRNWPMKRLFDLSIVYWLLDLFPGFEFIVPPNNTYEKKLVN